MSQSTMYKNKKIVIIGFVDTNSSPLWEGIKDYPSEEAYIKPEKLDQFIIQEAKKLLDQEPLIEKIVVLDMGQDTTHPSDPYTVLVFLDERANVLKIIEVH